MASDASRPAPHLFVLPGQESLGRAVTERLGLTPAAFTLRRFPDRETYVRIHETVDGRGAVLVALLDRPDESVLPLLLLADTLRDLGAERIVLVAPYLPYMRQDRRFDEGEGVTSR
ncbi:MAG: ribose-phosphate pyrophosphokinase-like domain-containing protein, partial [Planctomycetota bacterium]